MEEDNRSKKKCYICGRNSVSWESDVDADCVDADWDGIIHYYYCKKCGSRFTVYESFERNKQNKISGYYIEPISHSLADDFLKRHHYLAQQGNGFLGKVQYGLFTEEKKFVGCIVFAGVSAIETLIGAFDGFDKSSDQTGFWELTRLAMDDENKIPNLTSWFVARAIRKLRHENYVRAIISYADSKYHNGYIYQATSWKYYGLTASKKDFFDEVGGNGGKIVQRGYKSGMAGEWRERSRKHRYMKVFDKSLKILWKEKVYPKGDNTEYELQEPSQMQMNIFDYL